VVKAFNSAGSGPQSHDMHVTTLDGHVASGQHLTSVDTTGSTISLRWTSKDKRGDKDGQTNQAINGFTLHYKKDGDNEWKEKIISGQSDGVKTVSTHVLSGLESGVNYKIYVTANNKFGISDPSNIVIVKTIGSQGKQNKLISSYKYIFFTENLVNKYSHK
jgi:hypothetical protein